MIRSTLILVTLAGANTIAFGAPRHDPVVIVTPPRDNNPLLTRVAPDRPVVRTFTRNSGVPEFEVPATGVPQEGPLQYGIAVEAADDLIAVRTREPLPTIVTSPYQVINERTREEIRRQFPYVRRSETVTEDIRRAQNRYLKDIGAVLTVRSFSGDRPQRTVRATPPSSPRVVRPDEDLGVESTRVLPQDDQSPE